jgi:hypothetical protein
VEHIEDPNTKTFSLAYSVIRFRFLVLIGHIISGLLNPLHLDASSSFDMLI